MASRISKAGFLELILWALRRRARYRVEGCSMLPALNPKEEVLSASPAAKLSPGDVVVMQHPLRQNFHLIKRISEITSSGEIRVEGDNSKESTDSREFGLVDPALILGRVTSKL